MYAELRNLNNLRLINTEEKLRCMNWMNRWLDIYFPEFRNIFKNISGIGSLLFLEQATLSEDIIRLGVDGINKFWRAAKRRGTGYGKAFKIISAASHSIGRADADCQE